MIGHGEMPTVVTHVPAIRFMTRSHQPEFPSLDTIGTTNSSGFGVADFSTRITHLRALYEAKVGSCSWQTALRCERVSVGSTFVFAAERTPQKAIQLRASQIPPRSEPLRYL